MMKGAVFLDTSAWFATISPRDQWHQAASTHYRDLARSGVTFLTTTFVLAEVHAMLLRWADHDTGHRFLVAATTTPSHVIVSPELDVVQSAISRWVARFRDQSFSLCDAVSFEVMARERVVRALAFDQHFAAAGFDVVR